MVLGAAITSSPEEAVVFGAAITSSPEEAVVAAGRTTSSSGSDVAKPYKIMSSSGSDVKDRHETIEKRKLARRKNRQIRPRPAPGDLAVVQDFLNTKDRQAGTDELATPSDLWTWLSSRGLLSSGAKADSRHTIRTVRGQLDPRSVSRSS